MSINRDTTDAYARGLEQRLDVALFDHGALTREPAAAAWLTRAALAAGDRPRAEAVTRATARLAARRPDDRCLAAAALHTRGLLRQDAVALTQASDQYAEPWARGSAAEDAAVILLATGDRSAAKLQLIRARTSYECVTAQHDLDRVRARMRELGVRTRHWVYADRPTFGWDSLTDTERRVVDLVAQGLTNRQVAQRLFLSPHTVAFHLRQVFRKLGINCRVQLTRMVIERSGADEPAPNVYATAQ
jgi:DNA-binding CsgD family transcriptional regulator